ncbi:hypothetical protein KAU32_10365 [bacterium]|nr:hypothetical protein [bacterium]
MKYFDFLFDQIKWERMRNIDVILEIMSTMSTTVPIIDSPTEQQMGRERE